MNAFNIVLEIKMNFSFSEIFYLQYLRYVHSIWLRRGMPCVLEQRQKNMKLIPETIFFPAS